MQIISRGTIAAFLVLHLSVLPSPVWAKGIHHHHHHHHHHHKKPTDQGPVAEANVITDTANAKEAAAVAKQAAIVANKVAEHSVKVTTHAKSALKHALGALHDARVDSQGLDKSQKHSLKKAEAKLREATKDAEYGKLQKFKDAGTVKREKMQEDLDKNKKSSTELEQMRVEVKELRTRLKKSGGDEESDKELAEMDAELEKQQKYPNRKMLNGEPTKDELKAEIESLKEQIDKLEKQEGQVDYDIPKAKKGVKAEMTEENGGELMTDVDMKPLGKADRVAVRETESEDVNPVQDKGIDVDTAMPYGDLEPFGREDTAQELTESSVKESDEMVDQLERAEVAEEKRSVFRALTRLRGAAITSFDGVARSQTGNIDEYNKIHKWRKSHPLHHLADEESDVTKWAFPDNADLLQVTGKELSHVTSSMDSSDAASMNSKEVMEEKIRDYRAINPGFSAESCTGMYQTKLKLGGAVPPTDFVGGCDEVCASAKGIKEYWGSGDMATYACGVTKSYGCVYSGTPPVTDIGC